MLLAPTTTMKSDAMPVAPSRLSTRGTAFGAFLAALSASSATAGRETPQDPARALARAEQDEDAGDSAVSSDAAETETDGSGNTASAGAGKTPERAEDTEDAIPPDQQGLALPQESLGQDTPDPAYAAVPTDAEGPPARSENPLRDGPPHSQGTTPPDTGQPGREVSARSDAGHMQSMPMTPGAVSGADLRQASIDDGGFSPPKVGLLGIAASASAEMRVPVNIGRSAPVQAALPALARLDTSESARAAQGAEAASQNLPADPRAAFWQGRLTLTPLLAPSASLPAQGATSAHQGLASESVASTEGVQARIPLPDGPIARTVAALPETGLASFTAPPAGPGLTGNTAVEHPLGALPAGAGSGKAVPMTNWPLVAPTSEPARGIAAQTSSPHAQKPPFDTSRAQGPESHWAPSQDKPNTSPQIRAIHGAETNPAATTSSAINPGTTDATTSPTPSPLLGQSAASPIPASVAAPVVPADGGNPATSAAETTQAIARQISARVPVAGVGFDVALAPEELGAVRLRMVAQDSGQLLIVHADRPETMDLMRRHIGLLEQELRALGHENLSVRFGGAGTNANPGNPGFSQPHSPTPASLTTGDDGGASATPAGTAARPGRPAQLTTDHLDLRL